MKEQANPSNYFALLSSGLLHPIKQKKFPDVSQKYTASFFRVTELG
jgi:hypothetical protein